MLVDRKHRLAGLSVAAGLVLAAPGVHAELSATDVGIAAGQFLSDERSREQPRSLQAVLRAGDEVSVPRPMAKPGWRLLTGRTYKIPDYLPPRRFGEYQGLVGTARAARRDKGREGGTRPSEQKRNGVQQSAAKVDASTTKERKRVSGGRPKAAKASVPDGSASCRDGRRDKPLFAFDDMPSSPYGLKPSNSNEGVESKRLAEAYFKAGLFAEASYRIGSVLANDPSYSSFEQNVALAIRLASRLLQNRDDDTLSRLDQMPLCRARDVELWKALRAAVRENDEEALELADKALGHLTGLPDFHARRAALILAEAAVENGRNGLAAPLLNIVEDRSPTRRQEVAAAYLKGRLDDQAGKKEDALSHWRSALRKAGVSELPVGDDKSTVASWLMLARNHVNNLQKALESGSKPEQARSKLAGLAQDLADLQYEWRGSGLEPAFLELKRKTMMAAGRYREFLEDMRNYAQRLEDLPDDSLARIEPERMRSWVADALAKVLQQKPRSVPERVRHLAAFSRYGPMIRGTDNYGELALTAADNLLEAGLPGRAAKLARSAQKAAAVSLDEKAVERALRFMVRAYLKADKPEAARQLADRLSTDKAKNLRLLADLDERAGNLEAAAKRLGELDAPSMSDRLRRGDLFWRAQNWNDAARVYADVLPRLIDAEEPAFVPAEAAFRRVASLSMAGQPSPDAASAFPGIGKQERQKLMQPDRINGMVGTEPGQRTDGPTDKRLERVVAETERLLSVSSALKAAYGNKD